MAPKTKQLTLSFTPRATFPERRGEGAIVVVSGDPPQPPQAVASSSAIGPSATPARKRKRVLSLATKNEIIKFRKTHSLAETMACYPEASRSTIIRLKGKDREIQKAIHGGRGQVKRSKALSKYKALGENLHSFFVLVRDAHGAVSRALLEEYIAGLPQEIQLDLMEKAVHRCDEFFTRWRRWYKIVYRRVTGVKQFLPEDYTVRVRKFQHLLRSM